MATERLQHALNTRLSADQWQLLEETADQLDLTMSGALRWHLDQVLDRQVADETSAPTRRELMHEDRDEGIPISPALAQLLTAGAADN